MYIVPAPFPWVQYLTKYTKYTYLLVMSSSWNFSAWAEPSYGGSEPSRGTLILKLKPSWQYVYQISQFCSYNMILVNFMINLNLLAQNLFLELNNMI